MATKRPALVGIHYQRRQQKNGTIRWHVYAWRGGPKIMEAEQVLKPALTSAAVAAYTMHHANRNRPATPKTFAQLADAYVLSPEYGNLAAATKKGWSRWVARAKKRFGRAPLTIFADPRMRGTIRDWRNRWKHAPREADFAMQVMSRILSWGMEDGRVGVNPVAGISKLYKADRSDIIWTDDEIEAVSAKMQSHVARAFRLAAWTGLPRTDLLKLRWDEVLDDHILRTRHKTRIPQIVPLLDEAMALIDEFKQQRKTALTVVTNRRGAPFTVRGFAMAIERARKEAGVANGKTLHDLRGTFATRLMTYGLRDGQIDEILGWAHGKSARVRKHYISRRAVVMNVIDQVRTARAQKVAQAALTLKQTINDDGVGSSARAG